MTTRQSPTAKRPAASVRSPILCPSAQCSDPDRLEGRQVCHKKRIKREVLAYRFLWLLNPAASEPPLEECRLAAASVGRKDSVRWVGGVPALDGSLLDTAHRHAVRAPLEQQQTVGFNNGGDDGRSSSTLIGFRNSALLLCLCKAGGGLDWRRAKLLSVSSVTAQLSLR
ncbi:hypothetical protein EYF80_001360 [Liparis tanakae]|uniref:Uncharacterized protein n=1 Tax=Liparis tanakae TaxID=230148 RepID=A0A4Z2JF32_9TELE|nr:hypothetical protein EYF80_001360 [Liparis tanakae]